ncbi:hypothetical protein VSX64_19855 [Aurantimonas sp. C2-6-R+9]|uniref:hypothetical protein n=1 Tax=unclassified Aurantimonas TaxID=2638230 RepID=UPI002E173225|nr:MULTISPECIES: hypothetical protein [unclassified Aurantimonas]MEC5293562.1 hypothetical protein [Aurantimonas sp. C2-3-R2]MEC5383086.1 hypothetical protein [Aurantimonas sp. C2-6-R+9]MEC5414633.1 hypothetical protein [Aurantimonas sp. C2-4-R8]
MFKSLTRSIIVVAALATGGVATTAAPAAADGFRFGITIGERAQPVHGRSYRDNRGYRDDRGYRDYREYRPACEPRRAVRKASRMGVNRARVIRANRRAVVVAGRSRGDRAIVRFAREPGCPVLSFRRR